MKGDERMKRAGWMEGRAEERWARRERRYEGGVFNNIGKTT